MQINRDDSHLSISTTVNNFMIVLGKVINASIVKYRQTEN